MLYSLPNLSATGVTELLPWETTVSIPEGVKGKAGKKARGAWATSPDTRTVIYSAVEGRNSRARVTKARPNDEGNPPHAIHGLVVDYDVAVTEEELDAGLLRLTHKPQVLERTLSGNARAIWLFEHPLLVPSYTAASEFLVSLSRQLHVEALAPGIDEGALKAPDRYYTWSGEFQLRDEPKLSRALVLGWWVEFAGKLKATGSEYGGVEIPFDKLRELLSAKYPRFSDWPNDFLDGAQGPSFWIDGSTSSLSAVVKPQGMMTWAAHATKAWWSWEDLLGAAATEYKTKQLGEAVEGLYYDGKTYWRRLPDGAWKGWDKTDLAQHLKTSRGVSVKPDKRGVSDIDRCLQFIHDHQHVDGAAPFALLPQGAIRVLGNRVLNTSTRKVLSPAGTKSEWGAAGQFPFISGLLDSLFDGPEQLPHFLAWLSFSYKAGFEQRPRSGANIILAGGTGTGKTLLARRVIGPLFGGYGEASEYLMGLDTFGAELFDSAIWCVDDAVVSSDRGTHRRFSELLKKMAANTTFRYHMKFRQACLVDWRGRVVVTCNRDVASLRIIPDLTISIRDKLGLYRCVENHEATGFRFPDTRETEDTLDRELPFFAEWLLRYEAPAEVPRDARFGFKPYLHPALVGEAHQSSFGATFVEILSHWRDNYFSEVKDSDEWVGTSFQLFRSFQSDPAMAAALRGLTVESVGRSLTSLLTQGDTSISCTDVSGLRKWTVRKID